MGPRRILFVAGTLGIGGAERQLLYMLRVLVERGHRPEVITLEDGPFAERIRDLGVSIRVLKPVGGPVRRLAQVVRAVRHADPDVIQASHNWVSAYVALSGRLLGIPSIGTLRSQPASTLEDVGALGHLALRLPKLIAANSITSIEAAVALGIRRERLVHLPNAVDTDRFHPREPHHDRGAQRPFTIMAIGRLTRRKRLHLFLDVMAEVAAGRSDVRAVLVGEGPEKAALLAQADRLGLADQLSCRETDDPASSYREADLMLFPSGPGEGMPNVVLEAMATGVPVVAFASGDVSQVVVDGVTGRLIEPDGDTAAMADAVAVLLDEPETLEDLGTKARDHVVARYSLTALGDNLDRLHRQAIGARGERPST